MAGGRAMLSEDVARYVALRRSLGFRLRSQGGLLRLYADFAAARQEVQVRTTTAVEWAGQAPSPGQRRRRLLTLRRFALAMRAEDPRHEVPPTDAFGRIATERLRPHIYTREEIARLLRAAAELAPQESLRPRLYVTLLGLLAATGLRVSEALALRVEDVTEDGLVIREAKFRKSRLVPLHETTRLALDRYLLARARHHAGQPNLFVTALGKPLPYNTVAKTFRGLARSAGLRGAPGAGGMRIHDLRHTFAVRSLEACGGADRPTVARHMTALSTYLGHARVTDTQWYLQATPRLMAQIAEAGETLFRSDAQ
jgi:integrase